MSRFPYITGIKKSIVDKIQNTSKVAVAGEKPFIQLTNFIDKGQGISYNTNTSFNIKNIVYGDNKISKRFPPVITGLEISAAGSLGSLRKAKVSVRFSSADELKEYENFFKVGNTQLVSWGWVDKTQNFIGDYRQNKDIATKIVNNIDNYIEQTTKFGNSVDFLAGILTNFNMQVNSDASVEVQFELSAPSEIVAYLEKNKNNKRTSVESKSEEKGIVEIVQALDLDGNLNGFSQKQISDYVINLKEDRESTISTFGETDDSYIQMGFALNSIVNKFRETSGTINGLLLTLDIEDSIANGHPNMISVSDNVIFPNKKTMGFKDLKDTDGLRVIEVDLVNTQPLGPFNIQRDGGGDIFPQDTSITIQFPNGEFNSFQPFRAGYIKNIYVRTEFLKEIAKGTTTIHQYLERVVSELNIAGAGLYELVIRETAKPKTGQLVYSIVDLTLEASNTHELPSLKLYDNNSRLTDISVTADLPKELATIMMMGDPNGDGYTDTNTTSRDRRMSAKMFKTQTPDPILTLAKKITSGQSNSGLETGTDINSTKPNSTNSNFGILWDTFKSVSIKAATVNVNSIVSEVEIFLKLPGANRIKLAASKKYGKAGQSYFGVFNDVSCVKSVYFGDDYKRKDALLPIAVKLSMIGISGITIGQSVYLNPSPVPWLSSEIGYWQVVNVEHSVNDTMWDTNVELKFRVK